MGARVRGCERRGHTVHSNSNSLSEELSPLGIASCLLCLSSCVVRLVSCVSRCVLGPVSSLATGQYYRVQASLPRPFVIHDLIRASKTGRGLGVGWVLHSVSVVRTSTTIVDDNRTRAHAFSSHTLFPTRTQQIRRRARGPGALNAQIAHRISTLGPRDARHWHVGTGHWQLPRKAPGSACTMHIAQGLRRVATRHTGFRAGQAVL